PPQVANPNGPAGKSLLEGWAAEHNTSKPENMLQLGRLGGGGSDSSPFLQHLGIAAADTYFGGSYPMYHSVYDNYHWMANFADPLFKRHVAIAKLMAGVAARLAGNHRLPFNYTAYAVHLEHDVSRLQADVAERGASSSLSVAPLFASVSHLLAAAQSIEAEIEAIETSSTGCQCRGGTCPMEGASGEGGNCPASKALDGVNERLFLAERGFLDGRGIGPHYTWFKHLVYGPEKDNVYATSPFPGIRDAIADVIKSSASKGNLEDGVGGAVKGRSSSEGGEEWSAVQHEIFRAARAIERAAKILKGQLL
ncbi:unnamed protein product, partial [Closterium sp. Naga37s-1]